MSAEGERRGHSGVDALVSSGICRLGFASTFCSGGWESDFVLHPERGLLRPSMAGESRQPVKVPLHKKDQLLQAPTCEARRPPT